jgi:TolB-like protein
VRLNKFVAELKRRNVFRVATVYAIVGWLLIQVAVTIKQPLSLPEWIDTFIIILIVIGFPIALVVAWVFELTPDGLHKTDEVEVTPSFSSNTSKRLNRVIISVLAVAVAFLLADKFFLSNYNSNVELEPSIAVLPFVNMSSDQDNEYFSDGLSEELLNGLAKIEALKVTGRTSAFSFKGKDTQTQEIGKILNVDHILEGSVRKNGNQLKITAQLTRTDNGRSIWSETFERELKDIFDIQEEISRIVISQLRVQLLPEINVTLEQRPTEILGAYEAYLEATQLEVNVTYQNVEEAVRLYKLAIELDPNFADAYSKLAYAYVLQRNLFVLDFEEAKNLIRKNIDKALLLDSNNANAYKALAYILGRERYDALLKATELAPNDPGILLSVYEETIIFEYLPEIIKNLKQKEVKTKNDSSLIEGGEKTLKDWQSKVGENYQEQIIQKAFDLDPVNPAIALNYSSLLEKNGEIEKSERVLNNALLQNKSNPILLEKKIEKFSTPSSIQFDSVFFLLHEALILKSSGQLFEKIQANTLRLKLFNYSKSLTDSIAKINKTIEGDYMQGVQIMYELLTWNPMTDLSNPVFSDTISDVAAQETGNLLFKYGRYKQAAELYIRSPFNFTPLTIFIALDSSTLHGPRIYALTTPRSYRTVLKFGKIQNERSVMFDSLAKLDTLREGISIEKSLSYLMLGKPDEGFRMLNSFFEKSRAAFFYDPSYLDLPLFFQYSKHPGYLELKGMMNAYISPMRANVINYLKEKGEWSEEWNEELK